MAADLPSGNQHQQSVVVLRMSPAKIAPEAGAADPQPLAGQLSVLFDGASARAAVGRTQPAPTRHIAAASEPPGSGATVRPRQPPGRVAHMLHKRPSS